MTIARRLSAALAAALLLFSAQADVYASSHCAHHAAETSAPADVPDEHAGHAGHGAPAEKNEHQGACTCLGMCASSGAVSAPHAAPSASFHDFFDVVTHDHPSAVVLPASSRYLIPFSTAPPHVS